MSVVAQAKECGGESKKDTPVPMPNTEVKLLNAESSWWATACEGRKLPRSFFLPRSTADIGFKLIAIVRSGVLSEWLKEHDWKSCIRV